MFDFQLSQIIAYSCLAVLTLWATFSDLKTQRIPNWLTVSALIAGLAWQIGFHGLAGLGQALAGFVIGFGTFFVLWMTGSSGGGDVKLMGAVGVWLGFRPTLYVLLVSTLLVLMLSVGRRVLNKAQTKSSDESSAESQPIRGIELALPVTIAVWGIVVLDLFSPTREFLAF